MGTRTPSANEMVSINAPQRVQKLMGVLQNKDKLSNYNCEKYKPLLDVDFNISHKCCYVMKKSVASKYATKSGKYPLIATTTDESRMRQNAWQKTGCNSFEGKIESKPMSFWKEQDILQYIVDNNIPIASVYGEINEVGDNNQLCIEGCGKLKCSGCQRTGCVFCGFGTHLEKGKSRFEMLKETHPQLYDYCMRGGEYKDGVWQPSSNGLGMKHCIDELNKIYGNNFIKY